MSPSGSEAVKRTLASADLNCGTCYRGQQCSSGQHKFFDTGDFDYKIGTDGVHSSCYSADCCYATEGGGNCQHGVCIMVFGLSDREYDRLVAAVDRADLENVARLLRANPRAVEFNFARSSLLVVGCDSTIAANLPLSPDNLARLVELTN